ncbi:MAG: LLM class flavin-dependent oxidoreductase [Clostridia bacterium]|nr:LLM class flavin-dependent oxidoreductase [Clostridia bacterium]
MKKKTENCRNESRSYFTREGLTMTEVVEMLADEHGWSESVPDLSGKLHRGSLRYTEAVELADVMGYDIVWQKCRGGR